MYSFVVCLPLDFVATVGLALAVFAVLARPDSVKMLCSRLNRKVHFSLYAKTTSSTLISCSAWGSELKIWQA